MNADLRPPEIVLAVHPTSRGFGWIIFEGPQSPVDWSVASAKAGRSARLLKRFERILKRYEPSILVVEEPSQRDARSEAASKLREDTVHLALLSGVDVVSYPSHVIAQHFSHVGATKKYEIAEYVASEIQVLSHRVPRKRRAFDGSQHTQALFDAAALAVVYYAKTDTERPLTQYP